MKPGNISATWPGCVSTTLPFTVIPGNGTKCIGRTPPNMQGRHFGDSILKDGVVMAPVKDGQPGLAYLFGSIGHNIAAYRIINDSLLHPRKIKGSLGIYITIPDYLKACYSLLRKYAPNAE